MCQRGDTDVDFVQRDMDMDMSELSVSESSSGMTSFGCGGV